MKLAQICTGTSFSANEFQERSFALQFLADQPVPFTDEEALLPIVGMGFKPGRVLLEKPKDGDCVQLGDGAFLVTYRYVILPEKE